MSKKTVITEKEVQHVAELAKLALKEKEVEKFKKQLSNIFDYVNQIREMRTGGVSETSQTTGIKNRYREDEVDEKRMLSQKEALSNAKQKHSGYFVVKAIFGEE